MRYKSLSVSSSSSQSLLVCALSWASVRLNTLIWRMLVISLIKLSAMCIMAVKLIPHSIKYRVGSSIMVVPSTTEKYS